MLRGGGGLPENIDVTYLTNVINVEPVRVKYHVRYFRRQIKENADQRVQHNNVLDDVG